MPDSEKGSGYQQGCGDREFGREGERLPGDEKKHH